MNCSEMNEKSSPMPAGDSRETENDIAELLAGVRNGDNEAVGILLERYKPLLKKSVSPFALTYPNEQEDFTQEAMVCLYKAALTYDAGVGSVTFGAYAKTCVHNGLISYQRRLKKQFDCDLTGDDWDEKSMEAGPAVLDVLIHNESLLSLLQNIEALPEKEKAVMHGVMHGRTTKDIAANLGLTVRAVESILYRTRKELRRKQA